MNEYAEWIHNCTQAEHAEYFVYKEPDGNSFLSIDGDVVGIKFCPWCGELCKNLDDWQEIA